VAVTEAFDLLGISIGDIRPVGDDRFDSIKLFIGDTGCVDDDAVEPAFDTAPFFVEFDEPARLDPRRVGLTWEIPAPARTGLRPLSSLGALLLHLLPFLLLVTWPTAVNEGQALIPIQLVIQEPPPPPPAPAPETPQPPAPPPKGKLASEDMGAIKPKTTGTAADPAPPAPSPKPPEQTDTQTAATAVPAPVPPPPPPKPVPPKEHSAVQLPKPSVVAPVKAPDPQEAERAAKYSGPTASRDEYLAYLVTLTRQHLDLLPMSVVGTRRGETGVSVAVQMDGTISHISISRPSPYPDIDKRIAAMVAAVQKFPPVPQWFQGNTLELELRLRFPDALEREN
jgi:TonB-like protein